MKKSNLDKAFLITYNQIGHWIQLDTPITISGGITMSNLTVRPINTGFVTMIPKQYLYHPVFLLLVRGHHTQKGGLSTMKRYNTPHRSRVVKTRMTEEEYAEFAERLSAYNMSQAEFIRQAITGAAIRPIITVSPVNDELLAAVGKLTAEYGRIGGNLNQIARTLNEWHSPYPQLAGEVRAAVSDLAALKFEILQKVGDAVGNIQTYQL